MKLEEARGRANDNRKLCKLIVPALDYLDGVKEVEATVILDDRITELEAQNIAMKNRFISIAKGCRSVKELPDTIDHDEDCRNRDGVISQIYHIVICEIPIERCPYEPLVEASNKEDKP